MNFIIVITGPTGSGKSTVAERIARAINKCVNIDADLVKHFIHSDFIYDDTPQGVEQWKLLGENIGQLAKNFQESGYNVIINGYINEPAWERIQAYVKFDSKFLLLPEIETTATRDQGRNPDIVMGKEAVRTHTTFFSTDPYFDDFIKINSTEQSVEETVATILAQINVPNQNSVNIQSGGTQDLYQVVDDQDNIIGAKPRNEIDFKNDYYRISGIWLTNPKGQILIAQRLMTKDKDPGKWGPAAAGTLEVGETYESNAYKEAEEEIGLTGVEFILGPKMKFTTPRHSFCQWFTAECDWPEEKFVLQPTEVEQVKWIDKNDFFEDVRNNPDKYLPTMPLIIDALYPEEQKTLE